MAVRSGRAIPPRLLEAPPEVNSGLQLYMEAFWELIGDRGPNNRIQWMSLHLYCRSLGLSREEERDMIYVLRRLDMAYVEWAKGKQDGKSKGPGIKNGSDS